MSQYRPLKYRDIIIILRNLNEIGALIPSEQG
jgi:hypothetical protein